MDYRAGPRQQPIQKSLGLVTHHGRMTIPAILKFTAIGLLACILPLLIVGGLGISDNPVGLGLLMVVGTPIVLIAATVAIMTRLIVVWMSRAR